MTLARYGRLGLGLAAWLALALPFVSARVVAASDCVNDVACAPTDECCVETLDDCCAGDRGPAIRIDGGPTVAFEAVCLTHCHQCECHQGVPTGPAEPRVQVRAGRVEREAPVDLAGARAPSRPSAAVVGGVVERPLTGSAGSHVLLRTSRLRF